VTRIAAGLSTRPEGAEAVREAASEALAKLQAAPVDLAFLFLTPEHLDCVSGAVEALHEALRPAHLLGCVAQGVIGGERELEQGPAVAVWAASLPGARIDTFHLQAGSDEPGSGTGPVPQLDDADLVGLLVDPFTFPADELLRRVNEDHPGLPVVGGAAAGAGQPGTQALVLDRDVHGEGAVGVTITGIPVAAVVSQGCAPLGRDAVITEADGNVILELAGQPALERLRATIAALAPDQQALASQGLLAGLVIDENKPEYGRGDFLMRSILGADESSGAIAIGEQVRVGQTVRFHARDAASADEDLALTLAATFERPGGARPAGALLFTCNGRGTQMFGEPDHDSRALATALGRPSLAGFFCGGEIGPIGGRSFLHGFTATMAVFLERAGELDGGE
jgi:small ligand-binding sensory domain FIST